METQANFVINHDDKFYPNHHMWSYCTFLGKYTDDEGNNYDLGILIRQSYWDRLTNATVTGPEPQEYSSGEIRVDVLDKSFEEWLSHWSNGKDNKHFRRKWLYEKEIVRRAKIMNIIPKEGDVLVW